MGRGAKVKRGWSRDWPQPGAPPTPPRRNPWKLDWDGAAAGPSPTPLRGSARGFEPGPQPLTPPDSNAMILIPEGCEGLADLDGKWVPAPVEWDVSFRPQWIVKPERIVEWVDQTNMSLKTYMSPMPMKYTDTEKGVTTSCALVVDDQDSATVTMGDIVPRYWIPEGLEENFNSATFWEWFKSVPPFCVCSYEQEDLVNGQTRPWWQQYQSRTAWFLVDSSYPVGLGPDLEVELDKWTQKRLADQGSAHRIVLREERLKKQAAARKRKDEQERRAVAVMYASLDPATPDELALVQTQPADTGVEPKMKLEIRNVTNNDAGQCRAIYNHYVRNGCVVPDHAQVSDRTLRDLMGWIKKAQLPFLVATKQGTNHVVGFIHCDDYNDDQGLYKHTVELQVFVRPEHERQGIASVLMNHLLAILDPEYTRYHAANVNTHDEYFLHVRRHVKTILVNIPFGRDQKPKWLIDWLGRLGWEQAGLLREMGCKHDQVVDLAILQRLTRFHLEPPKPSRHLRCSNRH